MRMPATQRRSSQPNRSREPSRDESPAGKGDQRSLAQSARLGEHRAAPEFFRAGRQFRGHDPRACRAAGSARDDDSHHGAVSQSDRAFARGLAAHKSRRFGRVAAHARGPVVEPTATRPGGLADGRLRGPRRHATGRACPPARPRPYLRTTMADASNAAVVTFHPQSRDAGLAILAEGGNAFDAFVAATMADYVVAAGGTSLAGPLGVLVFAANERKVEYLDAEFNESQRRGARWKPGDPLGKAMLVPGAPAGLEALSWRYGRLSFARCLAPAIRLARDGFVLDDLYCRHIELCAALLRGTAYGRRTFFRRGRTPQPGD